MYTLVHNVECVAYCGLKSMKSLAWQNLPVHSGHLELDTVAGDEERALIYSSPPKIMP